MAKLFPSNVVLEAFMRHYDGLGHWASVWSKILLLAMCALVPVGILHAQEFRGTIVGQVTDKTGAVIPGATVTAVGPQQSYTATTNQSGDFVIPFVQPATYTVSAEQKGFKRQIRNGIIVDINARINLNLSLEVGTSTETVVIQAEAGSRLDTESGSGGTVMDPQKIQSLPNSGRLVYNLLGLSPGTQFTQTQFGSHGFSGTRAWDENNAYSFNGVDGNQNLFSLNGAPVSTPNGGGNGTWNIAPSIDAIEEFKVMTNTYDAQYGRYAGGTVNTLLKSGTRQYHGSLSDNWRNSVFDANTYDRNQTNQKRLFHNEHQYDITFGGEAIPHRDKLFFFFSYEGYRQVQPAGVLTSVPTADMLPGSGPNGGVDLTNYLTAIGVIGPQSRDQRTIGIYSPNQPLTCIDGTPTACKKWERQPYANNIIPASEITPIAAKIMALYPKPNLPGYKNNYTYGGRSTHDYDQPIIRVDYNISNDTKMNATVAWWHGLEYRNGSGFPGPAANGNINSYRSDIAPVIDITHTFSPNLFGDLRIAFNRSYDLGPDGAISAGLAKLTANDLGLNMPAVPTTNRQWAPQINVEGYNQLIGNKGDPAMMEQYDFSPSITQVIGRHNLHYGVEFELFHVANSGIGQPNGVFQFGTGYTWENPNFSNSTGNAIADLLLGYPDSGSAQIKYNTYKAYKYYAGYVQDDWKITHKLALNLGLRWDTETSPIDRHNRLMAGICLTCVNSLSDKVTMPGTLPNGASTVTQILGVGRFASNSLTPYENTWGALQPKFGFAYAVNNKLVVRGGYGLQAGEGIELGGASAWDQTTNYNAQINSSTWEPSQSFKSGTPFPNGLTPVLGTSQGDQVLVGNGVWIDQRDRKLYHTQQFSLGVQGELPQGIIGSVEYIGTYASNLRTSRQYDGLSDVDVAKGLADPNYLDQQVANPFYGVLPNTVDMGRNPTVAAKHLMIPYPQFNGQVFIWTHADGSTDYNSMVAKAEKRMTNGGMLSRGLSFLSSFTWAKLMKATDYLNNGADDGMWKVDRHASTHVDSGGNAPLWQFSFSGLYGIPVGRGGLALTNAHGVLGQIVNDWQLDWIFQNRSGWGVAFPNDRPYNCGAYNVASKHKNWGSWVNNSDPNCWSPKPEYFVKTYFGDTLKVKQPWAQQTQLGLEKKFQLKDQLNMLFKAEVFNVTNTPIFGGPDMGSPENPITRVTSVSDPSQPGAWSGYGTIGSSQYNFPRMMQFTLKILF